MNTIEVRQCAAEWHLVITPEQREYQRKVEHPRDLNEALLSVKHDEMLDAVVAILHRDLEQRVIAAFLEHESTSITPNGALYPATQ